jgi:uncharacterized protein (DUF2147 family)
MSLKHSDRNGKDRRRVAMNMKILAAAAALLIGAFPAHARAPKIGIHGGPQVDAGSYHVELVPQGTMLQLYFRDHSDKVINTQGWKGIAILTIDGKVQRITLSPGGDNQLKGMSAVDLPAEPKGAVQVTTSSGNTVQAKFD